MQWDPADAMRGPALLLAGNAAYALRLYDHAADRYDQFVSTQGLSPDAPQATLAQGWAELRLGRLDRAQRTWSQIARRFPGDERAPLGLLLTAHAAVQAEDLPSAQQWLDQLVSRYPRSPSAGVGRLSRSILAVRMGREQDAAPDLRELLRTQQLCAAQERHALLVGLVSAGADAPLMRVNGHDCDAPAGSRPLERFAAPFLNGAGDPETTPIVLHALVTLGVEDKRWGEVRVLSGNLVTGYPTYAPTTGLLVRVAGQAAADREWPVVRSAYEQILARDPGSPLSAKARLDFVESLLRTDAPGLAQTQLEQVARADQTREQTPRRLFLVGEVSETLGRPQDALAAYERLGREFPLAEWTAESLLPRARLLQATGQRRQARALLEEIAKGSQGDVFGEAAFRLAESLSTDGQHALAVKWYLTAAYVDTNSPWGQRAQLGAVQGLLATGDRAAADAIYRRMLSSGATDPALLTRARDALLAPNRDR